MTTEQIHQAMNVAQLEGVILLFLAVIAIAIFTVFACLSFFLLANTLNPDFIDIYNMKVENVFANTIIKDNGLNQKKVYNALYHAQKTHQ